MKLLICPRCGKMISGFAFRNHLFYLHAIGTPTPTSRPLIQAKKPKPKYGRTSAANTVPNTEPPQTPRRSTVCESRTVSDAIGTERRTSHHFTALIKTTESQQNALDKIFLAPEFCMYLLLSQEPSITVRRDAQLFLLQNKREIAQYLPINNRDALLDVLSDLVLEWSQKLPTHIRLDFKCTVLRKERSWIARVPALGDLMVTSQGAKGQFPDSRQKINIVIAKDREEYGIDFYYDEWAPTLALHTIGRKGDSTASKVRLPLLKDLMRLRVSRKGTNSIGRSASCPLCGKKVESGGMLMHKRDEHGESMYSASTRGVHSRARSWVSIYQGGAPGLGKGKS